MRTPELEARHRASVIVSRMFLLCLRACVGPYGSNNLSAVLPELLVAMAVRLNDGMGRRPASISEITRMIGIPRQTVRRHIDALIKRGIVIRKDAGIIGSDAFLLERIDAKYFKDMVAAIREAAKDLSDFQ